MVYRKPIIINRVFYLLLMLVFVRPHLAFANPIISVYLGDVLILLVIAISYFVIGLKVSKELFCLGSIHIATLSVIDYINILKGYSDIDVLFNLMLIMIYWTVLVNLKGQVDKGNIHSDNLYRFLDRVFCFVFLICLIQLFNPPYIGSIVKMLYGQAKLRDLYTGYPRVFGTFYNANWFGVYLIFQTSIIIQRFLENKLKFKAFITRVIGIIGLLMIIGSRSSLFGILVLVFFQFIASKKIGKSSVVLSVSILLGSGMFSYLLTKDSFRNTLSRYIKTFYIFIEEGFDMSQLDPGRWGAWVISVEGIFEAPFFGKSYLANLMPHNSFLYFINIYGLVGFLITILVLLGVISILKTKKRDAQTRVYNNRIIAYLISFSVVSLFADFFFTTQVMLVTIISIITWYININEIKEEIL